VKALITPVTTPETRKLPLNPAANVGTLEGAVAFSEDADPSSTIFEGALPMNPPLFDAVAKPSTPAVAPKSRAELRRLFLEQSAITLGQSWADQWRDDLRREGRPAAGGWPGTLREARVRVEHHLLAEVTRRKMSAVTEAEREVAARKAYASARAQWCRQAEPEAP
jgi:hypothetical protein